MRVALATFRRTREVLVRNKTQVTIKTLAHEMEVPSRVVRLYMRNIPGLAAELGVVPFKTQPSKYREAVRSLSERGVTVTLRRIAALTGVSQGAVREALRQPQNSLSADVVIVPVKELQRLHAVTYVRWMRLSNPHMKHTVTAVAQCLGWDRTRLQKVIRRHPSFRKDLGL